jgi:chorismate mutase / prephenate dehydratase
LVDAPSTSRAVQLAKQEPGTAAIAGELAAEHYAVPIVERNIQDKADNTTRFFVIGRKPSGAVGGGKDITSFAISLGDQASANPGALLKMLMPMAERGINLSKIESRPSKKRPWDYYFFIDVTGHFEDPSMKEALAELQRFCPLVKWLGSYPAAS